MSKNGFNWHDCYTDESKNTITLKSDYCPADIQWLDMSFPQMQ